MKSSRAATRCALVLLLGLSLTGTARAADVSANYISDIASNLGGGLRRGTVVMGKADLTIAADRPFGIDGASVYLDLEYVHGKSLSEALVGDFQTVSNIDAYSALRPFEAWIKVPLGRSKKSNLMLGLIDLNGIFDVQRVGHLFLSSSFGIGPDFSQSGKNGPSIFPTTSPAAVITAQAGDWSGRFGVFEAIAGDPERPGQTVIRVPGRGGFLLVAEADHPIGRIEFQLGGWAYTSTFDRLTPPGDTSQIGGNRGAYTQVETVLAGDSEQASLEGWIRTGIAQPRINPIALYLGGGLSYGKDDNRVGLAVAHARLGKDGRALASPPLHRAETAIELTYNHQLLHWLHVQPDMQYVVHPSWRGDIGNALVATLRLAISAPLARSAKHAPAQ